MNEELRLEELRSYQILDTPPEKELEELAELASLICDSPISQITLLDTDRQWSKVNIGLKSREIARKDAFCQHSLDRPQEVLVIEDALEDSRVQNTTLVTDSPYVRFYAGAPLETPNGHVLGSLCVLNTKPQKISENQKKALQMLAKKAMDFLTDRKLMLEQQQKIDSNLQTLKKLTDGVPGVIYQCSMRPEGDLIFDFLSKGIRAFYPDLDVSQEDNSQLDLFQLIHPEDRPLVMETMEESFQTLSGYEIAFRITRQNKTEWYLSKALPEKQLDGAVVWYGFWHNITVDREYQQTMEELAFDISHVLRKPVTNLLGLASMIEAEKDLDEEKLRQYSGYIKSVSMELDLFTQKLNKTYRAKTKRKQSKTKL